MNQTNHSGYINVKSIRITNIRIQIYIFLLVIETPRFLQYESWTIVFFDLCDEVILLLCLDRILVNPIPVTSFHCIFAFYIKYSVFVCLCPISCHLKTHHGYDHRKSSCIDVTLRWICWGECQEVSQGNQWFRRLTYFLSCGRSVRSIIASTWKIYIYQ